MILSIVQILIFISYITFILIKFGVISSISESWYKLKDLVGVWYSLFTWFCWGLGFTMFFQTDGTTPLFFIAGSGLCFVGVATMFKESDFWTPKIHTGGAVIGIIGSLVGMIVERGSWLPLIIFVGTSLILTLTVKKNRTWWIEILAFICIGLGLLFTS